VGFFDSSSTSNVEPGNFAVQTGWGDANPTSFQIASGSKLSGNTFVVTDHDAVKRAETLTQLTLALVGELAVPAPARALTSITWPWIVGGLAAFGLYLLFARR